MISDSIAIDGPAGSGKSTIAKIIAKIKNLVYIDTGAMYRAITLKLLNNSIDLNDIGKIKEILSKTSILFVDNSLILDGEDVTEDIRMPIIDSNVSKVAAIPEVRKRLVELQQDIARRYDVIMDGRDIGTRVLIESNNKFFITASAEVRGVRRYEELKTKGVKVNYDDVLSQIMKRDKIDSSREVDPLKQAEDAILIDTSNLEIEQVVESIIKKLN